MIKINQYKVETIRLQRGNKIIERPLVDYKANKANYEHRGFKPYEAEVKKFEPKVKKTKKASTKKD